MIEGIRARLSYANVMATAAVFIAVGGTAVASVIITSNSQVAGNTISGHHPPSGAHSNVITGSINSQDIATSGVGTADLANGAVKLGKISNNAVNGSNVVDGSLTGADINESTLSPGVFQSGVLTMSVSDPPKLVVNTGTISLFAQCVFGAVENSAQLYVDLAGTDGDIASVRYGAPSNGVAGHIGSGTTVVTSTETGTDDGGTYDVEASDGSFVSGHFILRGGSGCQLSTNGIAG
jgi:hypothetical protein